MAGTLNALDDRHFKLAPHPRGGNPTLEVQLQKTVLVCFTSSRDNGEQVRRTLAAAARGMPWLRVAVVNVSSHPSVVRMAHSSTTQITSTPKVIFYNNSRPFAIHNSTFAPRDLVETGNGVREELASRESALAAVSEQSLTRQPGPSARSPMGPNSNTFSGMAAGSRPSGGYASGMSGGMGGGSAPSRPELRGSTVTADTLTDMAAPDVNRHNVPWEAAPQHFSPP